MVELEQEINEKKYSIQEYEAKNSELNDELESLQFYQQEYAKMEGKCAELEAKRIELEANSSKLIDYESRIASLNQENYRTSSLLEEKNNEINSWKNKYMELENNFIDKSIVNEYEEKIESMSYESNKLKKLIEFIFYFIKNKLYTRDKAQQIIKLEEKCIKNEVFVSECYSLEKKVKIYEEQIEKLLRENVLLKEECENYKIT